MTTPTLVRPTRYRRAWARKRIAKPPHACDGCDELPESALTYRKLEQNMCDPTPEFRGTLLSIAHDCGVEIGSASGLRRRAATAMPDARKGDG